MRRLCVWFILLLVLTAGALAEETGDSYMGYFEEDVYVRDVPGVSDYALVSIPAYTAVTLTPYNERYATVTYNGVSGYVLVAGRVRLMPEETAVEPFCVYTEENRFLYDTPLKGGGTVGLIQAETPMIVTATVRAYYHVQANGMDGYIDQGKCTVLADSPVRAAEKEFYVSAARELLDWPLNNAQAVATLEPGNVYHADAQSRGFYHVTDGESEGWIAAGQMKTFQEDTRASRVALLQKGLTLYERPDKSFASQDAYSGSARLVFIQTENNGFYRLDEEERYIWHEDVDTFAVSKGDMQQLFLHEETALTLHPSGGSEETIATLPSDQIYATQYTAGSAYLLYHDGQWGFISKDCATVSSLKANERMNRTAALVTFDTVLYCDNNRRIELHPGDKVFLLRSGNDFYQCDYNGDAGFVLRQAVAIVSADAPLTAYTVAAPHDIPVMDFPDQATAEQAGIIEAGQTLEVSAFNRCYLVVSCGDLTGYAAQDGLITEESAGIPLTEDGPRYQVALDKSTYTAYVFQLDENGEPCAVVMSAQVGIGKRSTPTPSGVFTLGRKERWHAFTYSVTPHTTWYFSRRYIHGIPCHTRTESSKIDYMEEIGMVTGGCLRSPMEFARFIYMNCPSYQTELVIVSGGLAVPEAVAAPEEAPPAPMDPQ